MCYTIETGGSSLSRINVIRVENQRISNEEIQTTLLFLLLIYYLFYFFMQKFSLQQSHAVDLVTVLDLLPPKDCVDMKTLRLVTGAVKDIKDQLKEYTDFVDELNSRMKEATKPWEEKVAEKRASGLEGAELEAELKKLVDEANVAVTELFKADFEKKDEMGKAVKELELSVEKFDKVKELFNEKALEYFRVKDVCLTISDALDAAVKA